MAVLAATVDLVVYAQRMSHTPGGSTATVSARKAQDLASNIRAECARQRVSQSKIAEVLGVSQPGVSRRLNGAMPFTVNELFDLANLFNIKVSQLLPLDDDEDGDEELLPPLMA